MPFFVAIGVLLVVLVGAVLDPGGAINAFLCFCIDIVAAVWPATPNDLKLGSLLASFAQSFPLVGWGIILEIIQTCVSMLVIVLLVKLYKLLPFKAS